MSRHKNGYTVPHFQVVLGGQWTDNAGSYGLAIGAVPSKRVPEAVDRITKRYLDERRSGEPFHRFIARIGKAACRDMIDDLAEIPSHEVDPSFYTDWADAREFTIGDMGVGECAGEVIAPIDFQLTACEREAFEAQLQLEAGQIDQAAKTAYEAMLHAALALVKLQLVVVPEDPDRILAEFRKHFVETQLFWDPFSGAKFAHSLFRRSRAARQKVRRGVRALPDRRGAAVHRSRE